MPTASIRPRIWGRGNPRRTDHASRDHRASIRPRIWGRGNLCTRVVWRFSCFCFNSATDLGPWKLDVGNDAFFPLGRFNSATDLGPWKPSGARISANPTILASIRPRIWGRGNQRQRPRVQRSESGFNSATDLGPWKPGMRSRHYRNSTTASIRPRIWGRGNPNRLAWSRSSAGRFNSATDLGPWKHR